MVDAVARIAEGRAHEEAARADLSVSVSALTATTAAAYAVAARDLVCAPPQAPAWISAWVRAFEADGIVATVARSGRPVYVLALEVVRWGPFRVARLIGGTHANGNFAPIARHARPDIRPIVAAIRHARPDIDLLRLERLLPEHGGQRNPLLDLPHAPSPNVSLACGLAGGFTELLGRSSGKRKRKKYRSQSRKFDAAGGFRRIEARTAAEVERQLDAFLDMKAARFRKAGIANVFGDAAMRRFLLDLFTGALATSPKPFVLHALEVGGRLRAVTGSSRFGDTLICEFGAIVEDELSHASPGDFLFFENIREAAEQGMAIYDFSVGDELYKRLWCDIETIHQDVTHPLSLKGHALAAVVRAANRGKAYIKNSPALWRLVKTLRRQAAGKPQPAAGGDQDDRDP
ncbi:MAG: GNAT family N-acetyltransferase [Rhizobiaceae bacterium]|nr:GNAT family N-acetyltransferase [Rhizobiaceae bacterium]